MYKDRDKQREANRQAKERWKAKQAVKAVREALGIPKEGIPGKGIPPIDEDIPDRVLHDGTMSIETLAMMDAGCGNKLDHGLKRGKDIKVFEDLPPDVQQTIDSMSVVDGKINKTIKANRTAIAVNYQHLFPDRYHSIGIAI